ncbi:hypothetical protein DWV16_01365 [Anaerotruncus sp. AF02-27]|nr:hypothetical protein DWV16_01365 [Anaerotruncus sp. AF02-27]
MGTVCRALFRSSRARDSFLACPGTERKKTRGEFPATPAAAGCCAKAAAFETCAAAALPVKRSAQG